MLIAAEMVGANAGLGFLIMASQLNFQIPAMYAGILTIALVGVVFGAIILAGWRIIPRLFTSDADVIDATGSAWLWFGLMQPFAGVVFAIDGILVGAGDTAFMRNFTLVAVLGMIDSFSGTMFANEAEVLGSHPDRLVVGLTSIVDEGGTVVSSVRTSPGVGEVSPVLQIAARLGGRIAEKLPATEWASMQAAAGLETLGRVAVLPAILAVVFFFLLQSRTRSATRKA